MRFRRKPQSLVSSSRIPIIRRDRDGTIVDGTAEVIEGEDQVGIGDFRDLNGIPLVLPGGSSFEAVVPIPRRCHET